MANGGTVYFSPGEYTSGTVVLHDNVTLYIEAGAILFASRDMKDYKNLALIYACDAKNISILGNGKIDGQAERTYEELKQVDGFIYDITENARKSGAEMKMYYKVSPVISLIIFENCSNIRVRDVSVVESTSWTLHFKWCEDVFIDNVYIFSSLEKGVNADGIDIDGTNNVVISNSIIETGDDAIVLKTTKTGMTSKPCENITVTNCILTSTSTALKLGTESHADFRHIIFSNCVIRNTNRGLSIVIRDGATVDNVIFSNITIECNRKAFFWWGNGDPIWVVLLKRTPDSKLGSIRNVTFNNIIAYGQGTSKIEGYFSKPLENIKLSNVQLFMEPESRQDKRATHGFMAHDVDNLSMTDCEVHWNEEKTEPLWATAFVFEKIRNLRLDKISGMQAPGSDNPAIIFSDVQDVIMERCFAPVGTGTFLKVSGEKTKNVIVNYNYLQNARQSIGRSPNVSKDKLILK